MGGIWRANRAAHPRGVHHQLVRFAVRIDVYHLVPGLVPRALVALGSRRHVLSVWHLVSAGHDRVGIYLLDPALMFAGAHLGSYSTAMVYGSPTCYFKTKMVATHAARGEPLAPRRLPPNKNGYRWPNDERG